MAFLRKHYEKIILGALLLIFILLLTLQLMILKKSEDINIDALLGLKDPRPDYKTINFQDRDYNLIQDMLADTSMWQKYAQGALYEDLCTPPQLVRCPSGPHMIPAGDYPKQNAEKNKECSFCGKSIRALISDIVVTSEDSDGDGIPDKDEKKFGLNPTDPNDAKLDTDNDGFTNLEEYLAGTNMNDPKSRPSYAKKLYVKTIESIKIPMKLAYFPGSREEKPVEKWNIQLEMLQPNGRWRNRYVKIGEEIQAGNAKYKVVRIIPDFSVNPKTKLKDNTSKLVIRKVGTKQDIVMELQKELVDPRQHVVLYFEVDKNEISTYVGEPFKVGDARRGVDTLVIESVNTAKNMAVVKTQQQKKETIKSVNECPTFQGQSMDFSNPGQPPMDRAYPMINRNK